ncbi:hypothetical protein KQX54_015685 [Cotesia glomerata]|uniref:Uncharacterized protein n=1 Tax=Cotesia glomerata TaxID=32391 RepID=A0AAV7ITF0_COTGL|nr:hypothetical protein KQX54_015685 [Cotesia glomerata]
MGHGERSRAAGGSKKWKCYDCGENTWSASTKEWSIGKGNNREYLGICAIDLSECDTSIVLKRLNPLNNS